MTRFALLLRNLRYHLRGNLAVFLGIVLGTAVLTGALLVGDSLRGSLQSLALDQLGWVEEALTPGRFFRQQLAKDFPSTKVAPVIMLQGSMNKDDNYAGKVQIYGVDPSFWPNADEFWNSESAEVVLNQTLATLLGVKEKDSVKIFLTKIENGPRETLLGKRSAEDVQQELEVVVRKILPDEGMGRFSLRPSPVPVRNAFLPLRYLQQSLKLKDAVNGLLFGETKADLQGILKQKLDLADWNLKLRTPDERARSYVRFLDPLGEERGVPKKKWQNKVPDDLAKEADDKGVLTLKAVEAWYQKHRPYLSLESSQMFLEPAVEEAGKKAALKEGASAFPVLIYLADSLRSEKEKWDLPYAIIAAVPPRQIPGAVGKVDAKMDENFLYLSDWQPHAADEPLKLSFYVPDDRNALKLQEKTVVVKGTVPLSGEADDPDWTPEFPGITDKADMANWEKPPFPYDSKRVKPRDEEYWKRYKTSPKAYVSLATGQKWWASRFGKITSLRISLKEGKTAADFKQALLSELKPELGGFTIQPIRALSLQAGSGSTDFGVLFLSFSFFLIVSALLLVGLLVRLNLDRRAEEMGLLLATGWSHPQVRRLILGEGLIITLAGALLGLGLAVLYAEAMLKLLRVNWPGGGDSLAFLQIHAKPATFAIGYVSSVLVSMATLGWATRGYARLAPWTLLAGQTQIDNPKDQTVGRRSFQILVVSLLGAGVCLLAAFFVKEHEAQAGSFFGSGFLFLAAFLAWMWRWLKSTGRHSDPQPSLAKLAIRNAGRNPVRSLLTSGLLAGAAFLVVAVQAFHKDTDKDFLAKTGGSGGFALFAETDLPFFQDINLPAVRDQLFLRDDNPEKAKASKKLLDEIKGTQLYSCRVQPGDDASCLNLYQPLKPRVLGVSEAFIQRGGFAFAGSQAKTPEEKEHPWKLLDRTFEDGSIPAIIDANTAMWILKVGLGDTLDVKNDQGEAKKLRIVALLQESIFQSEVLVADSNFLTLFPRQEGFQFFLIDTGASPPEVVRKALQTGLAPQGWNVQETRDRVRAYLAVENMYLATFQALGGLGLLLGALGLAIVLVRGVWERRSELALLRALGFQGTQLGWLVLCENAFLLIAGLAGGCVAALLAVAPHLIGSGASVLWGQLGLLLSLVLGVGLIAAALAVWRSLQTPVLTALRRE